MGWKQPIPTDLEKDFGDDKIAYMLFLLLLVRARNEDTVIKWGGKFIKLKRGQSLFGRNSFCRYFGLSPSGIEKVLKRLEKVTGKVTSERTTSFTIVTIKNYDEITSMSQAKSQASNKRVTSEYQASNTNKNVLESVKSVKSVKDNTYISSSTHKKYTLEELAKIYVDLFNKVMKTKYKSIKAILKGLEYWLQTYEIPDIEIAIRNIPSNKFWKDKMTPTILFRRKNPQGEDVDYIGNLLNH